MKLSPFLKGFVIVLAMILLAGGVIFVNRIVKGDAFNQEEARHALYGMWIWRDIKAGDWRGFWYDTGRQMIWPFLHSWLLSIFFLIFGVGYISARSMSLLIFLASIILIYLLSSRFSEKSGWKIGVLSSVLMLTSPITLRFASENMIEGLGALIFLAASYLYMICEERKLILYYVFLAIVLGLSIYTNYIYAFLMLPSFLIVTMVKLGPLTVEAIQLSRKGEKAAISFIWWAYKKLIVLIVLLILAGFWFSFNFSRRIMLFLDVILRSGMGKDLGVLESLIYYPKEIIQNLSFSPWLGFLLLGALLVPFVASHYRGLNKLYCFAWTVLILAALIIPAKTPQMIYIIVPFVFIIFSASFFFLLDELQVRNKKRALLLIFVLLLSVMIYLPRAYSLYFPSRADQSLVDVLDYFKISVPDEAEIGTILNLKRFNPEVVRFHFREGDGHILTEDYLSREDVIGENVYFLTLYLDRDSPYQKDVVDDSLYRWNVQLQEKEMRGKIRLYSSRRFEHIGITAKVYKNISSRM